MKALRRLFTRLLNFITGRRGERRLWEEMEEHLALQTEENMRAGMTPAEARRQAVLKFGPGEAVRESYHAEEGLPFVENLLQDSRYAVRQLRRSPGYAALAVITLALGIGANTAIFLLTWSILLKSLPVAHPDALIRYTFRKGESEIGLSYPQYVALGKNQGVSSGLLAWQNSKVTLRRNGQAVKTPIGMATGSVFGVLQLHPVLGRGLDPRAGEPGAPYEPEVVLTYDYWRTEYRGDPSVIGQSVNLEGNSLTIVGVLAAGFNGLGPDQPVDMVTPLSFERVLHGKSAMIDASGSFWLTVMGRLRPGATVAAAVANLAAKRKQVNEAADPSHMFLNDGFFSSYELGVETGRGGRSWLRWKYAKPLVALEVLCGLMMLLCAVNIALLVVSRVSGRLQEFAVRSALGASRGRLLAQVLTESLFLGLAGLACGGLLGWQLASVLVSMISMPGEPAGFHLQGGLVVFLFAAGISVLSALLAGLWPAWRASHTDPAADLKQSGSGRRAHRLGRWIIPCQVALGVVLLNAALLLTSTLRTYLRENSGFAAGDAVLAEINLKDVAVPVKEQPTRAFSILHAIEAAPGVQSAAMMSITPLGGGFSAGSYYSRDAHGNVRASEKIWPESVSSNYFAVMGTSILQGRAFAEADASGERVCILSAAAAALFFPDKPALGEYVNDGDGTEKPSERVGCRVIGIAADARLASLLDPAPATAYFPIERRESGAFGYATMVVRGGTPQIAADTIRRIYNREFAGSATPRTWLFRDAIDYDLSRQRLLSGVSGGFGLLALALVATGLYGILARTVTERRREIGIRMALGAHRTRIVANLARTAAVRIGIGAAAGAALAAAGGKMMRSLLYGVTPYSPWVAVTTLAMLLAVLGFAFVFPAGRAASVDPVQAIREE